MASTEAHVHGKNEDRVRLPAGAPKRSTKAIGDVSEAKVIAAFVAAGVPVAIPFGENHRYDLIIERSGLERVQVKTGRLRGSAIRFSTSTSHWHRGGEREDYRGVCDLFAVYCPETDKVYLLPVDAMPARAAYLNVNGGSLNGHGRRAEDFEF